MSQLATPRSRVLVLGVRRDASNAKEKFSQSLTAGKDFPIGWTITVMPTIPRSRRAVSLLNRADIAQWRRKPGEPMTRNCEPKQSPWRNWAALLVLPAAALLTGCQVEMAGQTLPSPYYLTDDVQYYAPGPGFKLAREAAAQKEQAEAIESEAQGQVR